MDCFRTDRLLVEKKPKKATEHRLGTERERRASQDFQFYEIEDPDLGAPNQPVEEEERRYSASWGKWERHTE